MSRSIEERVELLEYKFNEICDVVRNWQVPQGIKLPRGQLIMANCLRRNSPNIVPHNKIFDDIDAFAGLFHERSQQSMKVQICSLRKNLQKSNVHITTHHGIGYSMPTEAARAWDKLCRHE